MALASSSRSVAKQPTPPSAAAASNGGGRGPPNLSPVLALLTDPSTSTQYDRHATQLIATLQAAKSGFSAGSAQDGVPQVLASLTRTVASGAPGTEALQEPLGSLLQHCGLPIVCTTLHDQRLHKEALECIINGVGDALQLPQAILRVTAATVLRQIFAAIRGQCFDDLNENPNATFHKKKELQHAISPSAVKALLWAWRSTVDAEVSAMMSAATQQVQANAAYQLAEQEGAEEDGGQTAEGATPDGRAAGDGASSSSSDDDEADKTSRQAPAAAVAPPEQQRGYEMGVLCRAVLELTTYRTLSATVIANGGIELLFSTLQLCPAGDKRVPMAIEMLWNLLTLCPDCATHIGQRSNLDVLRSVLVDTLSLGFKLQERELRNDVVVVLGLVARNRATHGAFANDLLELLLVLSSGAELGRTHPAVNPTHHATTRDEELQLKLLAWDALASLCRDAEIAENIFDGGLFDVLLAYANVECEVPAVVAWSTLQVLDIQAHVLRLLQQLADRGAKWLAECNGPAVLRAYVEECPKRSLRNQAIGVLSAIAATTIRLELVAVGCVPLAIRLLSDPDLDLRIDCLNLLADTVRRDPGLQRDFRVNGGIDAVLPLLSFVPEEYTDLLEQVLFATVDCVWECVFGSEESEAQLVARGGVRALLRVLETSPSWMVQLPLSCLADLLQNPDASRECRSWRSPQTGRSGVQVVLSYWDMDPPERKTAAEAVADNTAVGLSVVKLREAPRTLPMTPGRHAKRGDGIANASGLGDTTTGGATLNGTVAAADEDGNISDDDAAIEFSSLDVRPTIRDAPDDIDHIVESHGIDFKVFAVLAVLGFDGHTELDAEERATLAAVQEFVALCKDEVWESVQASLAADGIEPISGDAAVLLRSRAEAEERSTKLVATRRAYDEIHRQRKEESERTFYQSLIKKTEEQTAGRRGAGATAGTSVAGGAGPSGTQQRVGGKTMGLSITEAKIRKAQMLKQSFQQAVSQGGGTSANAASPLNQATTTDGTRPADALVGSGSTAAVSRPPPPVLPADLPDNRLDTTEEGGGRWDPGQRAMTDAEYAILSALNEVRTDPTSLVPAIEEKLRYLDETGSTFYVPGCDPETCVEGPAVYREAIAFLQSVRPLVTLLDVPTGMVYAARDHIADLAGRMDVSADGTDGSTPASRLSRYGKPGKFAHLTALGHATPVGIVMQLVIDDGVKNRADRTAIFDPDARCCGLSVGSQSIHDTVVVIHLAHEYEELPIAEQRATHEGVLQSMKSRPL